MKKSSSYLLSFLMVASLVVPTAANAADRTDSSATNTAVINLASDNLDAAVARQNLSEISGDFGEGSITEIPDEVLNKPGSFTAHKIETKQELIDAGLSLEEATTLIDMQTITEKMKATGQKLDVKNGKASVSEPSENHSSISKEEIQRITELADAQLKKPSIERKDKIKKVNAEMEKHPDRSYFKEEFADGTWIEVDFKEKNNTSINSDEVKTYTRNEVANIDIYGESGSYTRDFIWKQYDPTHFETMDLQYTYNVSGGNHVVKLTGAHQVLTFSGIFELDNEDTGVDVDETNYDESPTIWCQSYSTVRWHLDLSTSITLGGIFTINIPSHGYWTQLQEVDISLVNRHHYATY